MNMKAMFGTVVALAVAIAATAYLAVQGVKPKPVETSAAAATPGPDGQYDINPFDMAAPGAKSKAVIGESHFKFGMMALGKSQTHEFEIKNEGEGSLRLAKGPLMCKCTMPVVPEQDINPGESIKIALTWKPVEPANEFNKEAVIWTNDPENPKIVLSVEGSVFPDPLTIPDEFALGEVPWNKDDEHTVHIASPISDDLQVVSTEVSHPEWMSVSSEPTSAQELARVGSGAGPRPQSGFAIKLAIKPHSETGPFNGWVKIKTNRAEEPLKLNVTGTRSGPISIHSEAYHAVRALIDMKRFKSGEGKSVKLFLFLEPFDQDLQISEVTSLSKLLSASLTKEPSTGKRDRYTLVVEAKKGINPGTTYTTETPDTLTIKTNHPEVPTLNFKVRYIVQ